MDSLWRCSPWMGKLLYIYASIAKAVGLFTASHFISGEGASAISSARMAILMHPQAGRRRRGWCGPSDYFCLKKRFFSLGFF